MDRPGAPRPTGERWSINLPAFVGVAFVFVVAVVIWVIASAPDDDAADPAVSTIAAVPGATTTADATTLDATTVTSTTTPATTAVSTSTTTPVTTTSVTATTVSTTSVTTTPTTTTPATVPPATTAPGAVEGAVLGDLAVAGRPMQRPGCDGAYITVLASLVGERATAAGVELLLDTYPGSEYLRTDQACPSLRPSVDGQPIYVVYLGPFATEIDSCTARALGPSDAYPRRLSSDLGPGHSVTCPTVDTIDG